MDISISGRGSPDTILQMTFELENISGSYLAPDLAMLNIPITLRRTSAWARRFPDAYPVVLALHGVLAGGAIYPSVGASLLPIDQLPASLVIDDSTWSLTLAFSMPRDFLHTLEDIRAATPPAYDMHLGFRLWGTIALASSAPSTSTITQFEAIRTQNQPQSLRIPRSDWIERLLPALGYHRSLLIEVPLSHQPPLPPEYEAAAQALTAAQQAFLYNDFRGTLKSARDVLQHLGNQAPDGRLSTFCHDTLLPIIGETKANMLDRALNALRDVVNAASHPNAFVPDRPTAAYVLESLATILRYLATLLS